MKSQESILNKLLFLNQAQNILYKLIFIVMNSIFLQRYTDHFSCSSVQQ